MEITGSADRGGMNTISASDPVTEMVQVLMLRKQMEAAKANAAQVLEMAPPPPPAPTPVAHDGAVDTYA